LVTDYAWADVFNNVIIKEARDIPNYKIDLPMYAKEIKMILQECGVEPEDFQELLRNTRFYKILNKKYGMRKMLKLTLMYNTWAGCVGVPKIKTWAYNDAKLKDQCHKFLHENNLLEVEGVEEGTIDCRVLSDDIKFIMMDAILPKVEPPILVTPKIEELKVSEILPELMEELETAKAFECLNKEDESVEQEFMSNLMENIEKTPMMFNEYSQRELIPFREIAHFDGIADKDTLCRDRGIVMTMDKLKEIMRKYNPAGERIEKFLADKSYDSLSRTSADCLYRSFPFKIMDKDRFIHHKNTCDLSEEIVEEVAPVVYRNSSDRLKKSYLKNGVQANILIEKSFTTLDEYKNMLDKIAGDIPKEDVEKIFAWNANYLTQAFSRATKVPKKAKAKTVESCKVFKERMKRHEIEIPLRVHYEQVKREGEIYAEKKITERDNKESKKQFILSAVGLKEEFNGVFNLEEKRPNFPKILSKTENSNELVVATDSLTTDVKVYHVNRFIQFVRQRFIELANDQLIHTGYGLSNEFKIVKAGRRELGIDYTPDKIEEIRRHVLRGGKALDYDEMMAEYVEKHLNTGNENLKNLYHRCVKAFNQILSKRLKNRRNFSRLALLSDDDKVRMMVGFSCCEYGLIDKVKKSTCVRATEIRKLCSGFMKTS
jgi:hypothetical protein